MGQPDPKPDRESSAAGINGNHDALAVDRAVGELRRGRAIAIVDSRDPPARRALIVAAVETAGSALLERLIEASPRTELLLTAERAGAAGLGDGGDGPMAIRLDAPVPLPALEQLAGIPTGAPEPGLPKAPAEPRNDELVLAAFGLAKAARLIPALVGFPASRVSDPSLHQVALGAILEHAATARNGIRLVSEARVPLAGCEQSRVALYRDEHGGNEHVAVIIGDPDFSQTIPVRLHSACLTGDLLGSLRCDCGEQLGTAVERIAELGGGVLLYLDQEGRSIGLANKLRAYQIQDTGLDTFDADRHLGFDPDERSYDVAAQMLHRLGVRRIRLLTNNPLKITALREHGIDVADRLPLVAKSNAHNERYLKTKRDRAGHLGHDDVPARDSGDQDRS